MSTPAVAVQGIHIGLETFAQGIKVDITDQLKQIRLFLADEGFVTVLEQVPGAFVTEIEVNSIASEKSAHE